MCFHLFCRYKWLNSDLLAKNGRNLMFGRSDRGILAIKLQVMLVNNINDGKKLRNVCSYKSRFFLLRIL